MNFLGRTPRAVARPRAARGTREPSPTRASRGGSNMSSRPCDSRAGIRRKHTNVGSKRVNAAGKKKMVGARKVHSSEMTPHSPECSDYNVKLLGDVTDTPEKQHRVVGCLACAGRHRKHTCAKRLWARRDSVASTSSDAAVAREMSSPVGEQPDEVEDYPEVQDVVREAVSGPHASSCAACAGSSWRHTCFDGVPRSSSKWRGTRMARMTGQPAHMESSPPSQDSQLEDPIGSVMAVEQASPMSADPDELWVVSQCIADAVLPFSRE